MNEDTTDTAVRNFGSKTARQPERCRYTDSTIGLLPDWGAWGAAVVAVPSPAPPTRNQFAN